MAAPRAGGGRELATRVVVGGGLAIITLCCAYVGGLLFDLFVTVLCIVALSEIIKLRLASPLASCLYSLAYLGIPAAALIWLRSHSEGLDWIATTLLIVWFTDIGAYFGGRLIGGPKLWPSVSPRKTWSGFFVGCISAIVIAVLTTPVVDVGRPGSLLIIGQYDERPARLVGGFLLAVLAQGGDLFESALKRRAGVKDSGTLLPGHGGVLDRIDSLIPVAPAVAGAVALGWL